MDEKIIEFENRFDILGNIYESPELLSMEPEETYRKLGKSVQNLQTKNTPKAANHADSAQNLIRGNGNGNFGSSNLRNTGLVDIYYEVAALAIALSNIKKAQKIRIHSSICLRGYLSLTSLLLE